MGQTVSKSGASGAWWAAVSSEKLFRCGRLTRGQFEHEPYRLPITSMGIERNAY